MVLSGLPPVLTPSISSAVLALMVLGHTRDFFSGGGWNPRDVTDPALFLTRWITHFCAPTFIFLAGLAAYLYGARGRSLAKTSRFLFTRGLLLILLEFTLVKLGWTFSFNFDQLAAGVIWAIGASMVVLAALVHLPRVALILGHNLLDGIHAENLGSVCWVWYFLHQPGFVRLGNGTIVFVMCYSRCNVCFEGKNGHDANGPLCRRTTRIRHVQQSELRAR
jgi:uncharacterized membrane protein